MKIALIEDNTKYRECLAGGLATYTDCKVIHKLGNALNLEKMFCDELPDIALVDINLPGIDGLAAVREIQEKFPNVQCIMLTVLTDMDLVFKCMQQGAKGYLVKNKDTVQKIVESMRVLYSGNYNEEFPLNGSLAKSILNHFAQKDKTLTQKLEPYALTERQKEILLMLYDGKSYKQIAAACNLSAETVNSHVKAIYPKLNIRSRNELAQIFG